MFSLANISVLSFAILAFLSLAQAAPKYYELDLTWETGAPDGQERDMVYVNGQFPGPAMKLKYGDEVEVLVKNNMPYNATIHFHGIEQYDTPWSDGVPGLSQRPILPGDQFLYKWTALQYGSYWYHGHTRGLVSDGCFGPIYIEPADSEPNPFAEIDSDVDALKAAELDSQDVMLSDWSKYTSEEYHQAEIDTDLDLYCSDSILINGKGSVNCQDQSFLNSLVIPNLAQLLNASNQTVSDKGCTPTNVQALTEGAAFNDTKPQLLPPGLQSGCVPSNGSEETVKVDSSKKWVSLNFIQAASNKAVQVSIDEHPMWIYAVDGSYIKPQLADTFLIYNGERYSAFVQLDKTPGDYTMRVANNLPDQIISGYGVFSYEQKIKTNASTPYINYGGAAVSPDVRILDETVLVPYNVPPPADTVDATYHLNLGRFGANYLWTVNNLSSFPLARENETPYLFDVNQPDALNTSDVIRTNNNTWIDLIVQVNLGPQNPAQPPHPMHKHSNKGYIIGRGNGAFNYSSVAEAVEAMPENFNISTAQYRDSFTTPAILPNEAWIAVRYYSANPGAWLFHCHIQTHLTGGMALTILDGVDAWPTTPDEYLNGNGEGSGYIGNGTSTSGGGSPSGSPSASPSASSSGSWPSATSSGGGWGARSGGYWGYGAPGRKGRHSPWHPSKY